MARTAILAIKIISDASKATAGMNQAAGGVGKFASGVQRAALPAAAVGTALLAMGKGAR